MAGTVNSQITDAITQSGTINLALAPSFAMAMTYTTMADSIGIEMENATTTQNGMQITANAAVAQTCALIIAKGSSAA